MHAPVVRASRKCSWVQVGVHSDRGEVMMARDGACDRVGDVSKLAAVRVDCKAVAKLLLCGADVQAWVTVAMSDRWRRRRAVLEHERGQGCVRESRQWPWPRDGETSMVWWCSAAPVCAEVTLQAPRWGKKRKGIHRAFDDTPEWARRTDECKARILCAPEWAGGAGSR